jgi:hypothetical protein
MKSASTFVFTLIASALPLINAHGVLTNAKIDGKLIKGNRIEGNARDSAIRRVFSQDPIKGANNRDINCGTGAIPASLISEANPGSKLEFDWKGASGGNWPHNTGPMITYMASCGDVSCDKFDPIKAKWFKISQQGRKQNGNWVQEDIMKGQFSPPVTVPQNLAPGNYMVRHEIIALHLATQRGGAEFYAGCMQLKIGGSGTGAPEANELVNLPGAYKDDDAGIFVPDVFNPGSKYSFPGPPISKLAAKSNGNPDSGNSGNTGDSGKKDNKDGQCQLKVNKNKAQEDATKYRPRSVSRVMRDVKFH